MPKTPSKDDVLQVLANHGFTHGTAYGEVEALWEPTTIERLDACGESAYVVHRVHARFVSYIKLGGKWWAAHETGLEPRSTEEVASQIEGTGREIIFEGVKQ